MTAEAFVCSVCGWLNRGVDGVAPGGHYLQREGRSTGSTCPGEWLRVLVVPQGRLREGWIDPDVPQSAVVSVYFREPDWIAGRQRVLMVEVVA